MRVSFVEETLTVCVLVLSTGAFVNLFPGEQGVEYVEQGLLFAQILWSALYFVMFFFARRRIVELVRLIWQEKPLVLLLGWALLSVVWSIDKQVTVRHFIALLATSFLGVYLAIRYDLREQLRLVLVSLMIVITSSAVACIVFPNYATSADNPFEKPAWQGVLSHKNNLGTLAVLTALVLALYFVKRVRRATALVGMVLIFVLVVLTQAKTALIYFIIGLMAFPFVRAFQQNGASRRKIVGLGLFIFGGLAAWTYFNWETFVGYLGKDPSLTGRFVLWGLSMTWIREKPLLGYGFDAFWSDYYGPAADFRIASGWLLAPHAHNGFINLWLDLGLIGVLFFVLSFATTYRQALDLAKMTKTREGLWPVTFLTFLFVYGLTEISFLSRNDLFWILYVSVMFGLRISFAGRLQLRNGG